MRAVSLLVVIDAHGESGPRAAAGAHPRIDRRRRLKPPRKHRRSRRAATRRLRRTALFWSGLALGVAGVTTSALGLTVLRTEDSSTGNAPTGTYSGLRRAEETAIRSTPTNQCDALKGKNLTLLWGGVAIAGVGAALMIRGSQHERRTVARHRSASSIACAFDRWLRAGG